MSFTTKQKAIIASQEFKNPCCRRAVIYGMLLPSATAEGDEISVNINDVSAATLFSRLVTEIYGNEPKVISLGGQRKFYSFHSSAVARQLRSWDSMIDGSVFQPKCAFCEASFLKGIFLSGGRTTDPRKQYNVEISAPHRHGLVKSFCQTLDIPFKFIKRKNENILYLRRYEDVGDFLGRIGCMKLYVELYNAREESESRNKANRLTNCETSNIAKSVAASLKIINIIEALEEANLLSSLPEGLEETARLRLKYRDYSLSRLAQVATPPISKSGLSHRLSKIEELSLALLKK